MIKNTIRKSSSLAAILAVAITIYCKMSVSIVAGEANKMYIYAFDGAKFLGSDYGVGKLTLFFNDKREIDGYLEFVDMEKLQIRGREIGNNINLQFARPNKPNYPFSRPLRDDPQFPEISSLVSLPRTIELRFHHSSNRRGLFWYARKSIDGNSTDEFRIWRPRNGEPSEGALTLSDHECGPHSRTIETYVRPKTSRQELERDLRLVPEFHEVPVDFVILAKGWDTEGKDDGIIEYKNVPLDSAILKKFDAKEMSEPWSIETGFDVPVGTELTIVKKLRGLKSIAYADLAQGACGGADRAYFVTAKAPLDEQGKLSDAKLQAYIEGGLNEFFDRIKTKYKYQLDAPKVNKVKIPPFYSNFKFILTARSEVTRKTPGYWDRFSVLFEPIDILTAGSRSIGIQITVEHLLKSKVSLGNDAPPDGAYFKDGENNDDGEAIITNMLTVFFSKYRDAEFCVFEREGYEPPKRIPGCDA